MRVAGPINLNFFCHKMPEFDGAAEAAWADVLAPFYEELGLDKAAPEVVLRRPFDTETCALVEELKPEVVSFHFGLPEAQLMARLKRAGVTILSSATTVAEAAWLEKNGCDAVIAQGLEAGGHRATFLEAGVVDQSPAHDLLREILSVVKIPVIAAGAIMNAENLADMLRAGAVAGQVGTAYLYCPEAKISTLYREALKLVETDGTVLTNVFSGRLARGIVNRFVKSAGPVNRHAPVFPFAARLVAPLRKESEARGSIDFMQMWAGEAAAYGTEMTAAELTVMLGAAA